jgi:hypothetical protein
MAETAFGLAGDEIGVDHDQTKVGSLAQKLAPPRHFHRARAAGHAPEMYRGWLAGMGSEDMFPSAPDERIDSWARRSSCNFADAGCWRKIRGH